MYSNERDSLERVVLLNLELKGATLATAESCTGGLLAQRITSISGAGRSYLGGAVVYSNEAKSILAEVPAELVEKHGAGSHEVAKAMAEGIRRRTGADYAVGITGIAGPTGGTDEKPVGLVYLALSDRAGTEVLQKNFSGDRDRIRAFAAHQALDMLRRALTRPS